MNAASTPIVRLTLASAAILLTQCSMPPRDAWRIVQSEGLIPYLNGNYSYQPSQYQPGMQQSRYLASTAAPLQSATAPAPAASAPVVPYRADPGPVANRYLTGSYYEPEKDRTPDRPRSKPAPRRQSDVDDGPTPPPTVSAAEEKKIDRLLEPKEKPVSPPATKLPVDELPYGAPVSGRPGMVNSPFATKDQLVDVTGMAVGETVKCPYSGKLFRVPPTQAASAPKSTTPEPAASAAPEPPKPEPKSDLSEPKSGPASEQPSPSESVEEKKKE